MSQLEGTNQDRKLFAGMRIRRLRRELGLTQAVMADSLGISTSYLNLIERDQRPVSAQILIKMVDVFNIDPRGLAGDEEARAYTHYVRFLLTRCFMIRQSQTRKFEIFLPPARMLWMRLPVCFKPIAMQVPPHLCLPNV